MSEMQTAAEAAPKKAKTEYVDVQMTDGREVKFPVKRQVQKDVLLSEDGQAVSVRFDFINGQTITCQVPSQHLLYAAGHGYAQKLGDEFAGMKKENGDPADVEDKFMAVEQLHQRLTVEADWNTVRTGEGGVSGAAVVVKALMEYLAKTKDEVEIFIKSRMEKFSASRQAIYASFRIEATKPDSKLGAIIRRLEEEKAGTSKLSAGDLLADVE